jgi:DNA-binding transcriptional ArsR family regulator
MKQAKIRKDLTAEQVEDVAALFKALGEPMRLRIVQSVCHGPRSVGEIVEAVGSTQANVSKHLSLLAGAGVLDRVKDGQRVFYGVKSPMVSELCGMVCAHLGM